MPRGGRCDRTVAGSRTATTPTPSTCASAWPTDRRPGRADGAPSRARPGPQHHDHGGLRWRRGARTAFSVGITPASCTTWRLRSKRLPRLLARITAIDHAARVVTLPGARRSPRSSPVSIDGHGPVSAPRARSSRFISSHASRSHGHRAAMVRPRGHRTALARRQSRRRASEGRLHAAPHRRRGSARSRRARTPRSRPSPCAFSRTLRRRALITLGISESPRNSWRRRARSSPGHMPLRWSRPFQAAWTTDPANGWAIESSATPLGRPACSARRTAPRWPRAGRRARMVLPRYR